MSVPPFLHTLQIDNLVSRVNFHNNNNKRYLPEMQSLLDQALSCVLLPVKPFLSNGIFLHFFPSPVFFMEPFHHYSVALNSHRLYKVIWGLFFAFLFWQFHIKRIIVCYLTFFLLEVKLQIPAEQILMFLRVVLYRLVRIWLDVRL